jgi:hypothetical protein
MKMLGLTGGIVQVPGECKTGELKMGVGTTVYHFVENIEEVNLAITFINLSIGRFKNGQARMKVPANYEIDTEAR